MARQTLTKQEQIKHLVHVAESLPEDQIAIVSQFAEDLRATQGAGQPIRGTIDAVMRAMNENGHLVFEPGELEALLE